MLSNELGHKSRLIVLPITARQGKVIQHMSKCTQLPSQHCVDSTTCQQHSSWCCNINEFLLLYFVDMRLSIVPVAMSNYSAAGMPVVESHMKLDVH